MTLKNKITTFLLIASATFYGQEVELKKDSTIIIQPKLSYLDSIKATFVTYKAASRIDSLWMNDLTTLDVYDEMLTDIKNIDVDQKVDFELPTELLKERLKKMDEKSPFNIEYNVGLENVIKSFLKNRKKAFERMMGISQYYFPVFEEELAKNNIPLEIKYLAVVESALNPRAVSRVGATGLWQFMYQTGKQYGLNIDSYVDERIEPLQASQAASQYMNNMYKIFGDWDLVLAAYNSGPGNVAKAIRRSGGQQNYWNIRKNLPKETQGYLPAFLATMYIFEYHKEHGIVPKKPVANHFATDTVMVKSHMTFQQISNLLDVSIAEIQFFNPSYKRNEIPHISGQIHFLRLPKDKIAIFTSNEDKVYAYLDHEDKKRERPYQRWAVVKQNDSTNTSFSKNSDLAIKYKYYKVKRGDKLREIAYKYDVTISDIKKWNRLRGNSAPVGRSLKIIASDGIASNDIKELTNQKEQDSTTDKQSKVSLVKSEKIYKTEKSIVFKDVIKFHKVKKGDNLGEIATNYGVSVLELKKWNNLKNNNILLGDNIKIIKNEKVVTTIKKEIKNPEETITNTAVVENKNTKIEKGKEAVSKSENYYVVAKNDNLTTIAKKNKVSVQNIKDWNNLIDNNVKVGTQLIVSSESLEDTKEEDVPSKTEFKNKEHIVAKGEYLGTIARKYNTSVNNILEWNNLSDTNIKLGDKLIVSKEELIVSDNKKKVTQDYAVTNKMANEKLYKVQSGDSLYKISKKFPGVTISDIKKWNNIKDENLQPGMKLKING